MPNETITDFVEALRHALEEDDLARAKTLIGGVWHERNHLREQVASMRKSARDIADYGR